MKAIFIITAVLLVCSCRTKKINRTVEKKDSVVTNHQDSDYHSIKEISNDSFSINSYDRETTIYLNHADTGAGIFIGDQDMGKGIVFDGQSHYYLKGVDSIVVKEKGKAKTKTSNQTKSFDSGHVSNDNKIAVHTENKTVNKDIKANYSWMYVVASIIIAITILVIIIYKLKKKLKL